MTFEYNATGIEMKTFSPMPAGVYALAIVKVEEKRTKEKGYPMVATECEVDDAGPYLGRKIWHNVTFIPPGNPGASFSIEFLKAIGEPFEGQIVVDPQNWIKKTFKCKLKVEKDLKGNDRNSVAFVLSQDQADDTVPF